MLKRREFSGWRWLPHSNTGVHGLCSSVFVVDLMNTGNQHTSAKKLRNSKMKFWSSAHRLIFRIIVTVIFIWTKLIFGKNIPQQDSKKKKKLDEDYKFQPRFLSTVSILVQLDSLLNSFLLTNDQRRDPGTDVFLWTFWKNNLEKLSWRTPPDQCF